MSVLCTNGTFDLSSKTFTPTQTPVPVTFVDYDPSSTRIKEVEKLLEKYVGNPDQRSRLMTFMKGCLVSKRGSVGRIYTIYGSGDNGKSTFQYLMQHLLGKLCYSMSKAFSEIAPIPELNQLVVEMVLDSPARLVIAPFLPTPDLSSDPDRFNAMKAILDQGIDILNIAWADIPNHPLQEYMEPSIEFDAVFTSGPVDEDKRTFLIDWRISNTSYLQDLVQPLLWLLCNK
jgi:hypothetical protein